LGEIYRLARRRVGRWAGKSARQTFLVVVVVPAVGFAEQVEQGANDVEAQPAEIQVVVAVGLGVAQHSDNELRAPAHDGTYQGYVLEAIEGAGPVKF
jgi:hypothetical protein